jgi:transcriptional regulator with XRE-family HTH domain
MMLGLNQRALAARIGVPSPHLSRLELGRSVAIGLEELRRLVEVLDTTADYLLGLSDDPGEIPAKMECAAVA